MDNGRGNSRNNNGDMDNGRGNNMNDGHKASGHPEIRPGKQRRLDIYDPPPSLDHIVLPTELSVQTTGAPLPHNESDKLYLQIKEQRPEQLMDFMKIISEQQHGGGRARDIFNGWLETFTGWFRRKKTKPTNAKDEHNSSPPNSSPPNSSPPNSSRPNSNGSRPNSSRPHSSRPNSNGSRPNSSQPNSNGSRPHSSRPNSSRSSRQPQNRQTTNDKPDGPPVDASTRKPWIGAYDARLDILLAIDEYIYPSARGWSGSNPTALRNQIMGRINTPAPIPFFFVAMPGEAQGEYTQLMDNLFDFHTNAVPADVIEKESGMIATGWMGHAVGVYFRKLGADSYEVAIENTGMGCNWHGAPEGTPISQFHCEVAGVFVCRPVSKAVFIRFVSRLKVLVSTKVSHADADNMPPALFYRCVCLELLVNSKDDKKMVDAIYMKGWTPPWKHPGVAYFMRLPLQTSGDCAFRSVFFTALASPKIVERGDAEAKWAPPTELTIPAWFWQWYGALVAASAFVLVRQNEHDELQLTGPDLICLHDRLESLERYFTQASSHTFYPREDDKAAFQNATNRLRVSRKFCSFFAMGWYARTVLSSTKLLSDDVHVQRVAEITQIMPHRDFPGDDTMPSATIASDNKLTLYNGDPEPIDLRVVLDMCMECNAWSGLTGIADMYASENSPADLCRAEVVMLSQMLHRMLADKALLYTDGASAAKAVRFVLVITCKGAYIHRQNDMMLLYGLLYILLRRHLDALLKSCPPNEPPATNVKLLGEVINTFGSDVNSDCFNVPVYSKSHADMIQFVMAELRNVKVMTNPAGSVNSLSTLYFAVANTDAKKTFDTVICPARLQVGHSKWIEPMIFLTAKPLLANKNMHNDVAPCVYSVQLLFYLASLFNIGWFYENGQPIFYKDLATLEVQPPPDVHQFRAKKTSNNVGIDIAPCGFFDPTKASLDLLFDPRTHMFHRIGAMFRLPADIMLRYGQVGPATAKASPDSFDMQGAFTYSVPDLTRCVIEHLPAYEVASTVIDNWIRRVVDREDAFSLSCDRQEWNLMAFALVYLDSLYGRDVRPDDSKFNDKFNDILSSPKCGRALKLLLALRAGKRDDADPSTWATVLNDPLPVDKVGIQFFRPWGTEPCVDATVNSANALLQERYVSPDDDIYYDLVLTHACHVACRRWKEVRPSMPVMRQYTKEDLSMITLGHLQDSTREFTSIMPSPAPTNAALCESKMTCYQHFGREITFSVEASTLRDVADTSFIPVAPRWHQYGIVRKDQGWYTLDMSEPLPPHPYLQTHFVWTPRSDGTFYGEPSTSNRLKINNYCLSYDPVSKSVSQVPPSVESRPCDFDTLFKATDAATFVPMPTVFVPGGTAALRALCARLLSFCYSDRVLLWRFPDNSYRVEVLSHGAVFMVAANGAITFNGMEVLRAAPSPEWRFWTYQIPTVFLVVEKEEGGKVVDFFLLSMDVHRMDPMAIASTRLRNVFGVNDNPPGTEKVGRLFRGFHTACMAKTAEVHAIKLHRSGLFLLPTTSTKALGSLVANADRFGRTDVVKEVLTVARGITADAIAMPASTNFARDPSPDPFDGPVPGPSDLTSTNIDSINGKPVLVPLDADGLLRHSVYLELAKGRFVEYENPVNTLTQTWVKRDPIVPPPAVDYTKVVHAAPPTQDESDRSRYMLITRHARQGNIMWEMRPNIAQFLVEHKFSFMPLGYAQFLYIQNKVPRKNRELDQVAFASDVTQNFAGPEKAQIHNVLMGAGKTSIITPLIILNSVYGLQSAELEVDDASGLQSIKAESIKAGSASSIVVVTPSKLREQTMRLLLPIGVYMDVPLHPVVDTHFWVQHGEDEGVAVAPAMHGGGGGPPTPRVFVASDRALKESLIKRKHPSPTDLRYLLDEVDMVMNPFTSELNMPRGEDVVPFCSGLKAASGCMRPIIDFLFQQLPGGKASSTTTQPPNEPVHPPVTVSDSQLVNSHLGSLLQFVGTREFRLHYGMMHVPGPVSRTVALLVDGGPKDMVTEKERAEVVRHHVEDGVLAIPYLFADVPSVGSEFSDPLLTVAFTIESLKIRRLDIIQLVFWLSRCFQAAKPQKFAVKHVEFKYEVNKWKWVRDNLTVLQSDDQLLREYIQYYVPLKLTVYLQTPSACGLDLVMASLHPLRAGFTGTPEDVTIVDTLPINIKPKEKASTTQENLALNKLTVDTLSKAGSPADVVQHVVTQVAKGGYNVIIDVGSQFLGTTPEDLLCGIIGKLDKDRPLEIVYWDAEDRAMVLNRTGTVSPWSGMHRDNQVVFYDHAHTTGTDAVLMPDTNACITLRLTTRYRDFIQGLFRLRNIVKLPNTTCAVVTHMDMPEVLKMLDNNDTNYVESQSASRAQHNALALVRSVKGSVKGPVKGLIKGSVKPVKGLGLGVPLLEEGNAKVVETNVEYIRSAHKKNPFCDYLVRLLESIKPIESIKSIESLLNVLNKYKSAPTSMHSQSERQKEQEKEQEKEKEQERERQQQVVLPVSEFKQIRFPDLLTGSLDSRFDKLTHELRPRYRLLNNFRMFRRPGTTIGSIFRPLIVTINGTTDVVVMLSDAILLIDYLKHEKTVMPKAVKSVCIVDRSNNIWYQTGTQVAFTPHVVPDAPDDDEYGGTTGGRPKRSRPPCARRASRA